MVAITQPLTNQCGHSCFSRSKRSIEDEIMLDFDSRAIFNATHGGTTVREELDAVAAVIGSDATGSIAHAANAVLVDGNQVMDNS